MRGEAAQGKGKIKERVGEELGERETYVERQEVGQGKRNPEVLSTVRGS